MKRLELLIEQARRATENEGTAISDEEFVQYFNDAQEKLQTLIHNEHPESDFFAREGYLSMVSSQETYSLTTLLNESLVPFRSHIFAKNAISLVERTEGNSYYPLKMISNRERRYGFGYIVRDSDILISPIPSSPVGLGLRITYTETLPGLDIRRAQVNGAPVGNVITYDNAISGLDFTKNDGFITVVDSLGNIKASDLQIVSTGVGTVTVSPVNASDVAAISDNDWIVFGAWSTTHSRLPNVCEKYLLAYTQRKIFMRDSSTDASMQDTEMKEMQADLAELFADNANDATHVPIGSTDYMLW